MTGQGIEVIFGGDRFTFGGGPDFHFARSFATTTLNDDNEKYIHRKGMTIKRIDRLRY